MPKEALVLNGFGGGLNVDADEADIVASGEGKDEVTSISNLYTDYRGKVTAEHPIAVSLTGVYDVDSAGPIAASWQINQVHTLAFTQKADQSGGAQAPTGTGIQVTATVDGNGDPTFTIVDSGNGYLVDDTIIFVDPGNTSNEATIVVKTLIGTNIGITLDTTITSDSGQCLVYDDTLYQATGIYKVGEDIVSSSDTNYLVGKPTVGTLNDGTPDEHSDGVDLDAIYETSGDINIFKSKNASTNFDSLTIVMDSNVIGKTDGEAGASSQGPRHYIAQVEDNNANGVAGGDADFWDDGSGEAIRSLNDSYQTDLRADIFFMEDITTPRSLSSTTTKLSQTQTEALDFILFSRNGESTTGISSAGTTTANDDINFCIFRVGATQVVTSTNNHVDGWYGEALPSIAGKDLNVELKMDSMTNIDGVFIWADSDDTGSDSNIKVYYDYTSIDPKARIWKITSNQLTSNNAHTGYATFSIPYEAFATSGPDFNPSGVKMVGIGYACNGANPAATSTIMRVRQLSFGQDEDYGWNKNKYQFYQTFVNTKGIESLPLKYGPYGGSTIYEGLNYPAVFKIYEPNGEGTYTSGNVYYQSTDDSGAGTGPKLLLAKWDLTKGVKSVGSEDYAVWGTQTGADYVKFQFEDPPVASTYIFESGYQEGTESINALWKTAAIVGRTAYIGNVAKCAAEVGIICDNLNSGGDSYTPTHTLMAVNDGDNDYFQLAQHNHPSGVTWTDWEATHKFAVNQYLIVQGFGTASNNGIFKINTAFADVGNDSSTGSGGTNLINNKMFVQKIDGTQAGLTNESKTSGVVRFFGFDSTPSSTSDSIYDGSLILKGAVSKPAGFPDNQYIDLEFGGDEIINMVSSGDRLFVFSKQKLSIINVAQDMEFLEASMPHMGVKSDTGRNVCKVGEGVAWINGTGVYFFDGEQVIPISGDKISTLSITESDCAIGYDANRGILWVWVDATNVYFYSFVSQSWVGSKTYTDVGGGGIESNVVEGPFGRSFFEDDGSYKYIGDSAAGSDMSNKCEIVSGKISCGNIAQGKKFYKVNITQTNGVANNMRLYWRTNEVPTTYWTVADDSDNDNGIWLSVADGLNELKLTGAKGKWIQIKIISASPDGQTKAKSPSNMSIGDISIIHRKRSIK
tara:strand:+ start:7426 stop:10839 length:3414 start_codon:yes stop_codon:yes gene_type:complete